MGWRARPRWDRVNRRWHVTHGGRHYNLGADYRRAVKRFAAIVGREPDVGEPQTVIQLVQAWALAVGPTDWQRSCLAPWCTWNGRLALDRIAGDHLVRYAASLDRYSPKTVRHYVNAARRVLTWAVTKGTIGRVPARPKLHKPIANPRDVAPEKLADAFNALPDRAGRLARFILATGCRPNEACNLRWENVDADGACLPVHKTDRFGQTRHIFFTDEARGILGEIQHQPTGYVFLSRRGQPYTPGGLRAILRRRSLTGAYCLRHTFAQHALDQLPIEIVARLLGHADLQTVQVYARIRDRRAVQAARTLTTPLQGCPPAGQTEQGADATHAPAAQARTRARASGRRRTSGRPGSRRAG